MDEQVLLCVESGKFLLTPDEALQVCHILNGANHITSTWSKSSGGSLPVVGKPNITAASIVPVTAHFRLTLETNQRTIEGDK